MNNETVLETIEEEIVEKMIEKILEKVVIGEKEGESEGESEGEKESEGEGEKEKEIEINKVDNTNNINSNIVENYVEKQQLLETKEEDGWEKIDVDVKLLKEVDELKQLVYKIHQVILIQNETIERLGGNVENINHSLKKINGELDRMKKDGIIKSRLAYIRDYILPFVSILNTCSPLLMLMGAKGILYKYCSSYLLKSFVKL